MPSSSICSDSSMSTRSWPGSSESSYWSVTSRARQRSRERTFTPQDDYSGDDEEAPKRRRYTNSPTKPLLLACPFAKHFPEKRRELRACMTGWPSIPRLKQHLARCHAPETSCRRCHKPFKTEQDLELHIRADTACTPSPVTSQNETRIPASARHILNRRRPKGESAERAWNHFYKTLFAGVPKELVPSPYLDNTEDEFSSVRQDAAQELWKRLNSTLPRIVEEETKDILLASTSREVIARVVARISKTMGEFLGTEARKGYRNSFSCPSDPKRESELFEHPTCNNMEGFLSSEKYQPLNESTSQCSMFSLHPESEAKLWLGQFQNENNFPFSFSTADSSRKLLGSNDLSHAQALEPLFDPIRSDYKFDGLYPNFIEELSCTGWENAPFLALPQTDGGTGKKKPSTPAAGLEDSILMRDFDDKLTDQLV